MSQERRHHSAEEKVAVSEVCEEHGLSPNVFYRWQKGLLEPLK